MESRRHVRVDVRAGLVVARDDPGAHLLHAAAVESEGRRRGADRSRAPARSAGDAGVLAGRHACSSSACTGRSPSSCTSSPTSGATSSRRTRSRSARRSRSSGSACATARAERDPRVPHERLGHEARHRLRGSERRDRARVRGAVGGVLSRAAREVRRLVRGLLRSRRRLLREDQRQSEHVVHARRLPPASALRRDVREARGHPHGGLADPAREHDHARDDNTWGHFQDNRVEWLLGSSGRAHLRAYAERRLRRLPLRRRRRRDDVRVRRAEGRRHESRADRRQHAGVALRDDDGGYFRAQARAYYRAGALSFRKLRDGVIVVACLGDSITAGSPLWDPDPACARSIGGPLDERSQWEWWAAQPRRHARLPQPRRLRRAHGPDRGAARRRGRTAPTCSSCRAASTTSCRSARSRRRRATSPAWSSAAAALGLSRRARRRAAVEQRRRARGERHRPPQHADRARSPTALGVPLLPFHDTLADPEPAAPDARRVDRRRRPSVGRRPPPARRARLPAAVALEARARARRARARRRRVSGSSSGRWITTSRFAPDASKAATASSASRWPRSSAGSGSASVASQRKRSASRASSASAGVGAGVARVGERRLRRR